jgi:voltage-gated potassium channel
MPNSKEFHPIREKIHEIIFEADTPAGKLFDVLLLFAILLSVGAVMLETVPSFQAKHREMLYTLEWVFTIFFTIEYLLRLYCVYRPMKYAKSFFGIIDLLAILPTYLSFFIVGAQSLLVIRILRLMRVFRIFKLGHFLAESDQLIRALKASRPKITVFMLFVVLLVTIIGSVMYIAEGGADGTGFTSIPQSIYWAIVTLTTVGYGDITPVTNFGKFLSAVVMILGYAVLAVPTGIVSVEMFRTKKHSAQACRYCAAEGHDEDAIYCKQCGERLEKASH